jgi:hypothetical protein
VDGCGHSSGLLKERKKIVCRKNRGMEGRKKEEIRHQIQTEQFLIRGRTKKGNETWK